MVIFLEWHWTSLDLKSSSGLRMTSEGTGLEALASPLAGYLEKVQARAASLDHCPWCTAKGFAYALQSYRVNLNESITLCTNPQCLFPLVTRSLEDVLASLDPVGPTVGSKRKATSTPEEGELIKPSIKHLRSTEYDNGAPVGTEENGPPNGQHATPEKYHETMRVSQRGCPISSGKEQESPQVNYANPMRDSVSAAHADGLSLKACLDSDLRSSQVLQADDRGGDEGSPHHSALGSSVSDSSPPEVFYKCSSLGAHQSLTSDEDMTSAKSNPLLSPRETVTTSPDLKSEIAEITLCKEIKSEEKDYCRVPLVESEELLPAPDQLFWKNSDNLCWLDSLLVALVNCKSLRNSKPQEQPQQSTVWQLMKVYEEICVTVQAHKTERDGVVRVPNHCLQKANKDLQSLRMLVFDALQPKLQCKLGQMETPVFAIPLLLSMDSWAEKLFQSTFHWEFRCGACRAATKERVNKTISTCTNLLPDWNPLHAVHKAPCNVCRNKNQKRTMTLVRVPPVFALHFVEGLPHDDVGAYSFDFKGKHYSVTTVIQYKQNLKHFVTWVRLADGSWLEYDDLKYPHCKAHENVQVPAQELHILFWEVEENKDSRSCSPSSTFIESESQKAAVSIDGHPGADDPVELAPDFCEAQHDDDIVCALSMSDTTVAAERDTSIGENTLLDAFQGLSHSDIITLTLVELNPESEAEPHHDRQSEAIVSSRSEAVTIAADTSSAAVDGAKCDRVDVEAQSSSDTDSADNLSSDPTYEPCVRRGRAGPVTRSRNKEAQSKQARSAALSSSASSKTSLDVKAPPPQDITPPAKVSPINVSPPTATQKPAPECSPQFSYLLGRQFQKPSAPLVTKPRPAAPFQSTPNNVKRLPPPAALLHPKAQLRTEDSNGLPLKAAEMYRAFGVKESVGRTGFKPPQSVAACHPNTAVKPTTLTQTHQDPVKKHPSGLPAGLSSTDLLRHKLLKKLKAKKKKLAKLDQLLGLQDGAGPMPDSTNLASPSTVSSSTYDGSVYDDFLSDLLSPATTASNFSPDSTEYLEMLASGKDGGDHTDCSTAVLPTNRDTNELHPESFLEEFLSKAASQRPTDMEAEALGALELFI